MHTCITQPCPNTLGVYVGGGMAVCWAHLLKFGVAAGSLWDELPHIALERSDGHTNILSGKNRVHFPATIDGLAYPHTA